MKYCKLCLQPDTRPNSNFINGLCPACNYHEQLPNVNWEARSRDLEDICRQIKNEPSSQYDCIIGVSGGKDSTRQALYVRDKLKLKPLLVCMSYPPEQLTERGAANISNLINLGFDVDIVSPSAPKWKELKREGFKKFVNSFRSTELALFTAVPKIAIQKKIKWIFWGENPALQVGDLKSMGKNGWDGNNVIAANTLSSGHQWMLENGHEKDLLNFYVYPTKMDFQKFKIQIVYLGWFLGNWSEVENGLYSITKGLTKRDHSVERTADLYGITALDEDFTPINQYIKYLKFGFGRITDYVNEDIRNGRITRKEGIRVIEKYDSAIDDEYVQKYCAYLNISQKFFEETLHSVVNKNLFKIEGKKIIPKFKVGYGIK